MKLLKKTNPMSSLPSFTTRHLPQHFPVFETTLLNYLLMCLSPHKNANSLKAVPALFKPASPVLTWYLAHRRCSGNINSTNEQINQ